MRNYLIKAISCLWLLTFCSGCFPYHYSVQPGVRGAVVDQQTKLPLSNPTISLAFIAGQWNPTIKVSIWRTNTIVVTNGNGSGVFEIPPKRKWGIYVVPMDVFPRRFEVAVEQTNYETVRISFLHYPMATGQSIITTNFGRVQLNPKK